MKIDADAGLTCSSYMQTLDGMATDLDTIDNLLSDNSDLVDGEIQPDDEIVAELEKLACEEVSSESHQSLDESINNLMREFDDNCASDAVSEDDAGTKAVSREATHVKKQAVLALGEKSLQRSTLDAAAIVPRLFMPCVQNGKMPRTLAERMQQYEIAAGVWNDMRGA